MGNGNSTKKQPFLTIGIASYDYGKYLEKAFEKIKDQKFTDYEVLYCDDGSSDDSVEIIKNLINENPQMNIRLIQGDHDGILANKNRIVDNANGIYLMICDADDYMLPDCLEKLCAAAMANNADCVIGGFDELDERGKLIKRHIPPKNASKWLYTWHHAQIYKTQIIKANNIKFTGIPDDVYYLQWIHYYSNKVEFVRFPLYAWIRHKNSTSSIAENEWNPERLWANISGFIADMKQKSTTKEQSELDYYLYKWYYFNICDLPFGSREKTMKSIHKMQRQMESVIPQYKTLTSLVHALCTRDTVFARCAVAGCWVAEKARLLFLLPYIRNAQREMHEQ